MEIKTRKLTLHQETLGRLTTTRRRDEANRVNERPRDSGDSTCFPCSETTPMCVPGTAICDPGTGL